MVALYGPPQPADASSPQATQMTSDGGQVQFIERRTAAGSRPKAQKPPSRRELRRARKEAYACRDRQTFGVGSYKAYRERMYGKKGIVASLRSWLRNKAD